MNKYNRGFLPLVLLLFILAGSAVIGGGYYVVTKDSQRENVKVGEVREVSEPTPVENKVEPVNVESKPVEKPIVKKVEPVKPAEAVLSYGGNLSITSNLGWPVKVRSSVDIKGSIETYSGMLVLRLLPVVQDSQSYTLVVSGLPSNTDMYIYTNGYRNLEIRRSSPEGTLTFTPSTGIQYIIKDKEA